MGRGFTRELAPLLNVLEEQQQCAVGQGAPLAQASLEVMLTGPEIQWLPSSEQGEKPWMMLKGR